MRDDHRRRRDLADRREGVDRPHVGEEAPNGEPVAREAQPGRDREDDPGHARRAERFLPEEHGAGRAEAHRQDAPEERDGSDDGAFRREQEEGADGREDDLGAQPEGEHAGIDPVVRQGEGDLPERVDQARHDRGSPEPPR
jgi:hypothetical protein